MEASLFPITQDNLALLHPQARRSVFWELAADAAAKVDDPEFEKEAWLSTTLLEHGRCGFSIGYINAEPIPAVSAISSIIYCVREAAPGAAAMPTAPISHDAAVISSLFIEEVFRGMGMEAVLLDATLMDLINQEVTAVEAFGLREGKFTDLDPSLRSIVGNKNKIGLLEVPVLESAGFEIIADHPVLPRLRMELPPEDGMMSAREAQLLLAEVEAL